MLIADNEIERTWRWFLQFVKEHLDSDREQFRIIKDQDKGGRAAIAASLPQVKQFFCSQHRQGNIYKRGDATSGKAFAVAVRSWATRQLAASRFRDTANGRDFISRVPDVEQYPFVTGGLYGKSTTQCV